MAYLIAACNSGRTLENIKINNGPGNPGAFIMEVNAMKKYSDVFVFRDSDNNYIICYTLRNNGHTDIKPYTFTTKEAAESIADQMRKMEE